MSSDQQGKFLVIRCIDWVNVFKNTHAGIGGIA